MGEAPCTRHSAPRRRHHRDLSDGADHSALHDRAVPAAHGGGRDQGRVRGARTLATQLSQHTTTDRAWGGGWERQRRTWQRCITESARRRHGSRLWSKNGTERTTREEPRQMNFLRDEELGSIQMCIPPPPPPPPRERVANSYWPTGPSPNTRSMLRGGVGGRGGASGGGV